MNHGRGKTVKQAGLSALHDGIAITHPGDGGCGAGGTANTGGCGGASLDEGLTFNAHVGPTRGAAARSIEGAGALDDEASIASVFGDMGTGHGGLWSAGGK
jgi:hypothetical protein